MARSTASWNVAAKTGPGSAAEPTCCPSPTSPSWWRPAPTPGTSDAGTRRTTMSERTGLGVVEVAILEALETSQHLKCATVLARVEEHIGLAPGYAYEVLVDLARPWTMPINLVHGQGNFGSRGNDPAANFRYTEARITHAGRVALAAERGQIAPVPIALINGNTYRDGLRPPFRPAAIINAVREVIKRPEVPDKELAGFVGLP